MRLSFGGKKVLKRNYTEIEVEKEFKNSQFFPISMQIVDTLFWLI